MPLLAWLLAACYLATPPLAPALAVVRGRRDGGSTRPLRAFALTCVSGLVLGCTVTLVYARATDARAPVGQLALASYVFVGVLSLLKGASWLMKEACDRLFRLRPAGTGLTRPLGADRAARSAAAMMLRIVLLFALGMPYVMAVVMVYRPKVIPADDPRTLLGFRFEPVTFAATDGTEISGWWIPAAGPTTRPASDNSQEFGTTPPSRPAGWGERTVILCHGLGANKGNQLLLARDLVPNGYNVLAFDFRAHGASAGQVTSFGDLERRDVLGAVRWARANRPMATRKIYGLGVSMGAAALLAAAGDDSDDGRAIDAVAVYDTYDDLGGLVRSIAGRYFAPPIDWFAVRGALPLASAHAGTNLARFAPAAGAGALWPRPLLVIHGRGDEIIAFEHGVRLYNAAAQPKLRLWLGTRKDKTGPYVDPRTGTPADHNGVILSEEAARAVRIFFDWGQSIL